MNAILSENEWKLLIRRFREGRIIPFLGAGACQGTLPLGSEIAREWAAEYHYPFADDGNLVRVAQYLAVEFDPTFPKELILDRFKGVRPPDFRSPDEPHAFLAKHKLTLYLTTNYDDFMTQAIEVKHGLPHRDYCRWNDLTRLETTVFQREPNYQLHPATPLVFHLHGHTVPHSIVLTEDDYLSFLASLQDPALLPGPVRTALASIPSMLFLGYSLADWNIRVLLQGIKRLSQGLSGKESLSVIVMPPPEGSDAERRPKLQSYMEHSFATMNLKVYWGTARDFCRDLDDRMKT